MGYDSHLNKDVFRRTLTHLSIAQQENDLGQILKICDSGLLDISSRTTSNIDFREEVLNHEYKALQEFEKTQTAILKLTSKSALITENIAALKGYWNTINVKVDPILQGCRAIETERQISQQKLEILRLLKDKFFISSEESETLQNIVPGRVNRDYMDLIDRLYQKYDNCSLLLTENSMNTLGLGAMQELQSHLDASYDIIYQWIMRTFSTNLDIDELDYGLLGKAICHLKTKRSKFRKSIELLVESRSSLHIQDLETTITRLEAEVSALPDPSRFASNLLAWLHQKIATENEFLSDLLKLKAVDIEKNIIDLPCEPNHTANSLSEFKSAICDQSLKQVHTALSRKLEDIIRSTNDIITLFHIGTVLSFYIQLFSEEFSPNTYTILKLEKSQKFTINQLFFLSKGLIPKLYSFVNDPLTARLKAPECLIDSVSNLEHILAQRKFSLASSSFEDSLTTLVFNYVDSLIDVSEQVSNFENELAKAIFMLNCIEHIESRLDSYCEAKPKLDLLHNYHNQLVVNIIDHTFATLMRKSGCITIYECIQNDNVIEERYVNTFLKLMKEFSKSAFDNFPKELNEIENAHIRLKAIHDASQKFLDAFAEIELTLVRDWPDINFPITKIELGIILETQYLLKILRVKMFKKPMHDWFRKICPNIRASHSCLYRKCQQKIRNRHNR